MQVREKHHHHKKDADNTYGGGGGDQSGGYGGDSTGDQVLPTLTRDDAPMQAVRCLRSGVYLQYLCCR